MSIEAVGFFPGLRRRAVALTAGSLSSRIEIFVALAVIGIVFLLILPVPSEVIDVLIALNLFISGFLIVLSLYIPGITAFSTFPTILLLTTLFRLGISVATTRMILLNGDGGTIVETFGNFVVGGDLVVGLVVFLIVTAVQFIVLTKGAERIAEVSARFSLDAMPAKQMAIEGELRGGLIDLAEAKRQRGLLDTESQLLGSMDGAMKFVKGDAIAGLIIVAINLIGGLTIGVMGRGMSMGDAMLHYSILTVGDGLVAQIPALLISMTAAILITRGSQKSMTKSGNFGGELNNQLFAHPTAFGTLAAVMAAFALIPGMPGLVFGGLAVLAAGAAFKGSRRERVKETAADAVTKRAAEAPVVHEFNQMDALQLAMPESMRSDPGRLEVIAAVNGVRNGLVTGLGMTLPGIEVKYEAGLADDVLEFRVYEVPVLRAQLHLDELGIGGRHFDEAAGLEGASIEAGGGMAGGDVVWLKDSEVAAYPELQSVGVAWDKHLAARIEQKLLRYGPRFTGIQAAQKYLNWMDDWMPELAKELQKALPSSKYADVVQRLLRERISIRNMRLIMETLADYGQRERETAALAEYVRFALREQICHQLAPKGELGAYVFEPELEEYLSTHVRQTAGGGFLALSPQNANQIIVSIREKVTRHQERDQAPVLICAPDIRRYVRTMLEPEFPEMTVLSVTELTPEIRVNVITTIEFPGTDENSKMEDWDEDEAA